MRQSLLRPLWAAVDAPKGVPFRKGIGLSITSGDKAQRDDRSLDIGNSHAKLSNLLPHWRRLRGKSQLDLSLDTGISQRHISFIESGRSVPSRRILLVLANGLDIPLRERNALLLAAGYAPIYSETPWDGPEMTIIAKALERVLRQHEPYPAVVMDRYWNVLMTNDAVPRLFNRFVDLSKRPSPRNILHLMFDPAGMRPFIANWNVTARSLLERVRSEAIGRVVDEKTRELVTSLMAYPGDRIDQDPSVDLPPSPVIPLSFIKDGQAFNYFSMVSTIGSPQIVVAQEIRVECMFPADDETEKAHEAGFGRVVERA